MDTALSFECSTQYYEVGGVMGETEDMKSRTEFARLISLDFIQKIMRSQ